MSSRKEEKKEVTPRSSYSEPSSLTATEVIFAEYRDNFNRALNETKNNIKKSIDETRTHPPLH
jgi:hypothetical protein